ncbi:M23 family metallopeptidase [Lysobacter koreensis]|uniref:M23 family metallopeptidase n=1 Tax=Lysobacter koreensis TaxID=266122 RepID=A0ABW2YLJ9_9GAMM
MKSVLLVLIGLLVGANAVYFWMSRRGAVPVSTPPGVTSADTRPTPTVATVVPPAAMPHAQALPPTPSAPSALPATTQPTSTPTGLLLPVQGIKAAQLSDTFNDLRGGTRIHEALDIMAPTGTPVLATADGPLVKLFTSVPGGLTAYQFDPTSTYAYYYAHLDRYAPGIAEGQVLKRGQLIGYVGSTGNADPASPHLHFAVFLLGPEKQWWKGTPINPYPLLR